MYRLRRQANVPADRNATVNQKFDRFCHFLAAFELDHLRALNDVAQRIADQNRVNAGAIHQAGETGVVAGKHDNFFAGGIQLGEIGLGQAAGNGLGRHGLSRLKS